MRARKLGATDLVVSEIGLGAMTFGAQRSRGFFDSIQTTPAIAREIVARALDRGVLFIDTANVYGEGASEEILGEAMQGRRQDIVLATKVGGPMGDDPSARGLSRRHIVAECEESLRRLRTDFIDLYQAHFPDPRTPIEETLRALDDLVRAGKIRYAGASNFGAYAVTKALWVSDRLGLARFDALQMQYSLLVRDIEDEILPMCESEGLGMVAWSPLAQGFLSGKYARGEPPPTGARLAAWKWVHQRHDTAPQWAVVDAVGEIAAELGATRAQVALAWVLGRRGVTSVVLGARTVEQLDDNLGALDVTLAPEHFDRLTELSQPRPRYPVGSFRAPD